MFQSILQETLAEENWQEVQKLGGRNIPALFPWELSRSTVRIFLWEPIFTGAADPEYPLEWFEEVDASERGLLDIHAGAFETAAMNYFCPELVDLKTAEKLPSTSMDQEGLQKWLQGGDVTRESVPLGYAGNPAGYKAVGSIFEKILDLQAENIAKQIIQ